ncbi:unnamed protein product [Leptosia nina]|uniref:Uncharacterized protein n=1 Tax=Leptosia nina TaxID=320188 RepID=A0AAV1JCG5_9NEOP
MDRCRTYQGVITYGYGTIAKYGHVECDWWDSPTVRLIRRVLYTLSPALETHFVKWPTLGQSPFLFLINLYKY